MLPNHQPANDCAGRQVGESSPPPEYTIKEQLEYHITVVELVEGKWRPFKADDLQLEFVRIDPFIRTYLKPSNTGKFSVQFMVCLEMIPAKLYCLNLILFWKLSVTASPTVIMEM